MPLSIVDIMNFTNYFSVLSPKNKISDLIITKKRPEISRRFLIYSVACCASLLSSSALFFS